MTSLQRHIRISQRLALRRGSPDADRGSITLVMLVIVVTSALGAIMVATITSQSKVTNYDMARVRALDAAQSGIEIALGGIRAAVSTAPPSSAASTAPATVTGDDGRLPCGPWSAGNAGPDGSSFYTVISYYVTNPSNTDATAMGCTSSGPFLNNGGTITRTPRYAVITSTGAVPYVGGVERRTISTTYVVQTNDVNISGGLIRIFPAGSEQYCMDAGSPTPTAGTPVLLQPCSTSSPPADQQVFAYRSDLSIELVSSTGNPATAAGLCLGTSPAAHAATGDIVVLDPCSVPDSQVCPAGMTPASYAAANPGKSCAISPWNQQWSVDDNAHLRGSSGSGSSPGTDTDGYCIDVENQAANAALVLATCAGGVTDPKQTWVPGPTVGAGMAGAGNNQLVNYAQFATCLDVTGQDVNAPFLILYTCKQNPNPAKVLWNQKFTPSDTGVAPTQTLLTVTAGGTRYCLASPLRAGGYPVLSSTCPSSVAAAGNSSPYVWTVYSTYQDFAGTQPLRYADKYTLKDSAGLCLGAGSNSDLYNGQYSKATVAACNGSTAQKWNAAASLDASTITNTYEFATPSATPSASG